MPMELTVMQTVSGCYVLPAVACSHPYSTQLSSYKRGKGGRSSFSGDVVTVLGASGFIGKYIVNQLGKRGCQVVIPYRGNPYDVRELKLMGDLGQILFLPYDVRDPASLQKVMKYSNVVVNLVGSEFETKMYKFHDVNRIAARDIARTAKECGVERLIHFSAMNCHEELETHYIPGGSRFLRSKWYGEQEVKREFPEVTILRPADVFGQEDSFLTYYSRRIRRTVFGNIPLYNRGVDTVKMPIYVGDVADGVMKAMYNNDTAGKTYELVGPKAYYLRDLVDYIYRCMRYLPAPRITYVTSFFQLKMHLLSFKPMNQFCSLDKLDRETNSDVLTGEPTSEDLGLTNMTTLESRCEWEVYPYRRHAYMREEIGLFPVQDPPKSIIV